MTRMTAYLLTLVLFAPAVHAVPVPDRAETKLEALKKKLPKEVEKWRTGHPSYLVGANLRQVRQIDTTEAEITVLVRPRIDTRPGSVTIYLHYHDGSWTSTHWDYWPLKKVGWDDEVAIRGLMHAIDDAAKK